MGNGIVAVESFRLPLENGLYLEGEVRVPSGSVRDGKNTVEQALGRISASALIIQGDQDRVSLLKQNALFREQAPKHRYAVVRGADHTFNTTDPYEGPTRELNEALALTLEFLHDKLG